MRKSDGWEIVAILSIDSKLLSIGALGVDYMASAYVACLSFMFTLFN